MIRGWNSCAYHADILDKFNKEECPEDCETDCPGGGRISKDLDAKKIVIYGYS